MRFNPDNSCRLGLGLGLSSLIAIFGQACHHVCVLQFLFLTWRTRCTFFVSFQIKRRWKSERSLIIKFFLVVRATRRWCKTWCYGILCFGTGRAIRATRMSFVTKFFLAISWMIWLANNRFKTQIWLFFAFHIVIFFLVGIL